MFHRPRMRLAFVLVLAGVGGCDHRSPDTTNAHQPAAGSRVESLGSVDDLGGLDGTVVNASPPTDPLVPPIGVFREEFAADVDPLVAAADFSADERADFHAHGDEVCASGCAASRHPTPKLDRAEFTRLMLELARGPADESNPALESLLFHGRQTAAWIARLGTTPLGEERAAFLERELQRTHALLSFRIVDEFGVVRTHMPATRVPFDRRHVFHMETDHLPPLETSGTVKRVGLHHLWTRL